MPSPLLAPLLVSLLGAAAPAVTAPGAGAVEPTVRAVFFYSPTCPLCHEVMRRDLPALREQYGPALLLAGVDVSTRTGRDLYRAAVEHLRLPAARQGVPTLVVGSEVLFGSVEIPQRLPTVLRDALAAGGVAWPPVDGLRQTLEEAERSRHTGAAGGGDPGALAVGPGGTLFDLHLGGAGGVTFRRRGVLDLVVRDPVGSTLAAGAFLLLITALAWSPRVLLRATPGSHRGAAPEPVSSALAGVAALPPWLFPSLAVVGVGIAGYLTFADLTGSPAACGPVGECNAVTQSPWARIFGVVPVGAVGVAGYLALLAAWGVGSWGPPSKRPGARLTTWALAWVGAAFSAWLTFLELFIIAAVCLWCVASALIMAFMLAGATARATTARYG